MKRTSYIMLILLAVILVGSFLLPAVVYRKVEFRVQTLCADGDTVRVTTGFFITFDITNNMWLTAPSNDSEEWNQRPLGVTVRQNPRLTEAVLIMDRAWRQNLTIRNDSNVLEVELDMHSLLGNDRSVRSELSVAPDAAHVLTLEVPTGWVDTIKAKSNLTLTLEDFKEADMAIAASAMNSFDAVNCDFRRLTFFN